MLAQHRFRARWLYAEHSKCVRHEGVEDARYLSFSQSYDTQPQFAVQRNRSGNGFSE